MKRPPIIVIVGRPNVGKSTLFNRLTKSRRSLVHDLAGVTRDRIVGDAQWPGGGAVTLVDTGGLLLSEDEGFIPLIRTQADVAIREGDVVVLLLDGDAGLLPEDRQIAEYLRTVGVPVVPAVNKGDRKGVDMQAHEFYSLGLGEPVVISAEHGTGLVDLWEVFEEFLDYDPAEQEEEQPRDLSEIHVAIIGRPNVGKSSLLNSLVGRQRVLVSAIPGTTRDAVDEVIEREGRRFRFVDTAGIRRKGKTDKGPEVLSVVMARRHLERADLCVIVVDATEGVTRQDAHVAGYAWDAGRAVLLVVNKWDLIEDRLSMRAQLEDEISQNLKFMAHAPSLFLSALTTKGVHKLFPAMIDRFAAQTIKVSTSDLNRVLKEAWERNPPPLSGRKAPKFYYGTQVAYRPPAFVLFTNLNQDPHFSYLRYLDNVLREAFDLAGVPIRVMIRGRKS